MTHPNDIFTTSDIRFIEAEQSAADTLSRWRDEGRFGSVDASSHMLADLRFIDLWRNLLDITIESSDGSAESLKQTMYDCAAIAFFAERLYERVRFELNDGDPKAS